MVGRVLLVEIAIGTYFASSFLYYLKPLPLGHLINLLFLVIFTLLTLMERRCRRLSASDGRLGAALLMVASLSLVAWIWRDDWDPGGFARSLTWLTPVALLALVTSLNGLRHTRICGVVACIGVLVNVAITVGFGEFNVDLAKFEVNATWAGISSNELSFHLLAFGALFLFLMQSRIANTLGWVTAGGSLIHLSKAHLASLFAAPLLTVGRRRLLLAFAIVVLAFFAMRWLAVSETAATLQVAPQFKRVFEPLRDLAVLISGVALGGELRSITDLAGAVGLYRFEVYEAAAHLLASSPFGHSIATVDAALRGLDPHSNVLYLALREGWFVTLGYLLATASLLGRLPTETVRDRAVFGILVYVFLRGLFLTFDPVKLLSLALYAGLVLQGEAALRTARVPAREVSDVGPGLVRQ